MPSQLRAKKRGDTLWLDAVPERVMPGAQRQPETVYHFLLPDKGMANYTDKVVKGLAGEQIASINAWRKEFVNPLTPSLPSELPTEPRSRERIRAKRTENAEAECAYRWVSCQRNL